jgi:hypothetical protein
MVTDARFSAATHVITIDPDAVDSPMAIAAALVRDGLPR